MEKGEIAQNEQFHVFSTMFPMQPVFNSLISIVVCSFFEFEMVSKWSITKWVKLFMKYDFKT